MSSSPLVIYEDAVAYGWDTSYTFNLSFIDLHDRLSPFSGTSAIRVGLYQYGGLLVRPAVYFYYLTNRIPFLHSFVFLSSISFLSLSSLREMEDSTRSISPFSLLPPEPPAPP
jgi:hypothetical protein